MMSHAGSPLRRPLAATRAAQAAPAPPATLVALVALALICTAPCAWAGGRATPASAANPAPGTRGAPFQFSVIGHVWRDSGGGVGSSGDEAALRRALADAGAAGPAFIVATGVKAGAEPCSDKLYGQRRQLFNEVEVPLIVSLAGSDWTECLNSAGRSNAIERLNRLRELLFTDSQSLGGGA